MLFIIIHGLEYTSKSFFFLRKPHSPKETLTMSINQTNSVRIIHSLGGCGGTLLAQCIGVLQDVILLSECNPLSSSLFDYSLNPYIQIEKWYPEIFTVIRNEFNAKDLVDTNLFNQFIIKIKSFLDQTNKSLVIRDYNYIDYFGVPFLEKPPMISSLIQSIKNSFSIQQAILIRHPLTQYNSLRSHSILKDVLSPNIFLEGYDKFLTDFKNYKMIKYEDIVDSPYKSISDLSNHLNLPFSNKSIESFHHNQSVTGNFKRAGEYKISLSTQPIISDQWTHDLQTHSIYSSLLNILNYPEITHRT